MGKPHRGQCTGGKSRDYATELSGVLAPSEAHKTANKFLLTAHGEHEFVPIGPASDLQTSHARNRPGESELFSEPTQCRQFTIFLVLRSVPPPTN